MTDSNPGGAPDIEHDPAHQAAGRLAARSLQSGHLSIEETLQWQAWLGAAPANSRAFARLEEVTLALRARAGHRHA